MMNNKFFKLFIILSLSLVLSNCANVKKKNRTFVIKNDKKLITEDMRATKKKDVEETVSLGPKPVQGNTKKLNKRKKITSSITKNYLLIPKEYTYLKQPISMKFSNLDFKETIKLMAEIGKINILVGDEVAGSISAELVNVPWDKAFNAILDMKNFAADIDVSSNLIRIHAPATLTAQESYKSQRASAVKKKVEMEDSITPIVSEIFRLYYISPAQAKKTLAELYPTAIKITEESTTRSIIVRGKQVNLDQVEKVIREIDVRTKQVLIEAFIVEASSDFDKKLGVRLGGYYTKEGKIVGGLGGGGSSGSNVTTTTLPAAGDLGSSDDSLANFAASGATSGIGLLKKTTTGVLKTEITALEALGLAKTISNPKVFTLDNTLATISQGQQVPYQTTVDGTTSTAFKDATLKLSITPSIIGDGNVLLDISVNNDTPGTAALGAVPPINSLQIVTKLLIADGDIVVIGGIKKNQLGRTINQTPGIGDVPVIGNLFKGKADLDYLDELLIFIAPRVL
jgi:type IV pilus assembly protein PilQ